MKFGATLISLSALASSTLAAAAPKTYYLKTSVKSGPSSFNNLYLTPYHKGAGENDPVFLPSTTNAAVGYLVKTNSTPVNRHSFYNQQFQDGSSYPTQLTIDFGADNYAAWLPTEINTGSIQPNGNSPYSGFWFNSSGLQFTDSPTNAATSSFNSWLVCQWWRGVPELFMLRNSFNVTIPSSCAKVNLIPQYIPQQYS